MLKHALLAIAVLCASPASATPEYVLPTLFDVTGVASDDVLNIRENPSAIAPVIGSFAHDLTHIEVVEEQGNWGRVNLHEFSGWVSMRYLEPRYDVWQENALPAHMQCFGAEPFWSITHDGAQLTLSQPGGDDQVQPVTAILSTGWFRDPARVVTTARTTLVSTPQLCSDGMSDGWYGLRATVVLHGEVPAMLNGCCTIRPPEPQD